MGQEISTERLALYLSALSDLSEKQIEYGFNIAMKQFKPEFGKTFPYPAELRAWAEEYKPVDPIAETRRYLEREDKPTDWEAIGGRSGFTRAEVAALLEAGKQKQRDHVAMLEADPHWRRARLGAHASVGGNAAELAAAERNGLTKVPTDPAERRSWAKAKALESGWISREPGEEG